MKTAVEFLHAALSLHFTQEQEMQFEGLFQQALEMEKEQIMDAYFDGKQDYFCHDIDSEIYYNTIYNKTNNI